MIIIFQAPGSTKIYQVLTKNSDRLVEFLQCHNHFLPEAEISREIEQTIESIKTNALLNIIYDNSKSVSILNCVNEYIIVTGYRY